jgi:hypothetical protein
MLHLCRGILRVVISSRTNRDWLRALALCSVLALGALGVAQIAQAQEVSFTPRFDGIDQDQKPLVRSTTAAAAPEHERKVYSFARFSPVFKDMCASLRLDQREKRVFEASSRGLAESGHCGTCRALYRQMVQWCKPESTASKPLGKNKPTAAPSPTVAPTPGVEVDGENEDAEGAGEAENTSAEEVPESPVGEGQSKDGDSSEAVSEEAPVPTPTAAVTATPAPTPQPARYPSTELLDALSRLSHDLYELEPGFGNTFVATQKLSQDLLQQKELTPAERDYYSIFSSYLLSAWEGRPGSPLDPRVRAKEDVSELFQ